MTYFGMFFFTMVLLFAGFTLFMKGQWDASSFVTTYITIPLFLVAWIGWKFWHKTKFVSLSQMDFDTGRRELDEIDEKERFAHPPPTSFIKKVWDWLM